MADTERPAWVDDGLFPFESRFVDIDGHIVHYVDDAGRAFLAVVIEGAGHFVQSDAPGQFAAAIRDWRSPPTQRTTTPRRRARSPGAPVARPPEA